MGWGNGLLVKCLSNKVWGSEFCFSDPWKPEQRSEPFSCLLSSGVVERGHSVPIWLSSLIELMSCKFSEQFCKSSGFFYVLLSFEITTQRLGILIKKLFVLKAGKALINSNLTMLPTTQPRVPFPEVTIASWLLLLRLCPHAHSLNDWSPSLGSEVLP